MDSKLVVEQMSGRWKIKHPDLRPLALAATVRARQVRPATPGSRGSEHPRRPPGQRGARRAPTGRPDARARGLATPRSRPTSLSRAPGRRPTPLGRRRERAGTADDARPAPPRRDPGTPVDREFSGRGGADPGLTTRARPRCGRPRSWLTRRDEVAGHRRLPLRRTRETAAVVADAAGTRRARRGRPGRGRVR